MPDGRGGWVVARDNLGFPAGRKKTVLFDLTDIFHPGTPRRLRLRTNLEIYWDAIEWARGLPQSQLKTALLRPATADLHYRGYSFINRGPSGRVEIPDYAHLVGTKQRWRDLIGYYTRYGDVRELLAQVDDRYVIMNSGDEMTLKFPDVASATDRLAARLRHRRRRMDQGWGLQFDFFQNRAAIASSQRARLRDPSGKARGRVDVSATPGGLGEIPHPLRYSGGFQ